MSEPWGELQVDQLRYMAKKYAAEVAYRDLDAGTSLTFAEWDEQSNRLARFLVHQGVEPGDRISIYLPSEESLRWIISYAATHKAGAIAVPTNTRLSVPELITILGHAEVVRVHHVRVAGGDRDHGARPAALPASRRDRGWRDRHACSTTRKRCTRTARTSRSRPTSMTSPTSCTPRVRPDCRRASRSATATWRCSPTTSRTGPAAVGCTARRCSRSPASRSSTTP